MSSGGGFFREDRKGFTVGYEKFMGVRQDFTLPHHKDG